MSLGLRRLGEHTGWLEQVAPSHTAQAGLACQFPRRGWSRASMWSGQDTVSCSRHGRRVSAGFFLRVRSTQWGGKQRLKLLLASVWWYHKKPTGRYRKEALGKGVGNQVSNWHSGAGIQPTRSWAGSGGNPQVGAWCPVIWGTQLGTVHGDPATSGSPCLDPWRTDS